jgi:phenylpropionate dioxygenase-like ring-hydroxylating dioxygenase large terminal subunit
MVKAAGVRVVENFIDVSHLAFVHEGTLCDPSHSMIEPFEVHELEGGGLRSTPIRVHQPAPAGAQAASEALYQYSLDTPLSARFEKSFSDESYVVLLAVTPVREFESTIWLVVAHDERHSSEDIRAFQNEIMAQDARILEALTPQRLQLRNALDVSVASDRLCNSYRDWLIRIPFALGTDPT